MQRVMETSKISEISRVADTKVNVLELRAAYQGIVVEVTDGIEFQGTLVYVPGVTLKQLQHTEYD